MKWTKESISSKKRSGMNGIRKKWTRVSFLWALTSNISSSNRCLWSRMRLCLESASIQRKETSIKESVSLRTELYLTSWKQREPITSTSDLFEAWKIFCSSLCQRILSYTKRCSPILMRRRSNTPSLVLSPFSTNVMPSLLRGL